MVNVRVNGKQILRQCYLIYVYDDIILMFFNYYIDLFFVIDYSIQFWNEGNVFKFIKVRRVYFFQEQKLIKYN